MRVVLATALALLCTPVFAADLPVDGAYGSGEACALYAAGGADAVVDKSNGTDVLVTPKMYASLELQLETFKKRGAGYVAVIDDSGQTRTFTFMPSAPGTIKVQSGKNPPNVLTRCP